MKDLKNIFKIILLISYVLKRGVHSSSKNTPYIPDLNDNSAEKRDEIDQCITNIYNEFQCTRPAPTRLVIPRQVFGTINYNTLASDDAKGYFRYLSNLVRVKTRRHSPKVMQNPMQFCSKTYLAVVHSTLVGIDCITRLRQFYQIVADTTMVLKQAFESLDVRQMYTSGDYAYLYYNHIYLFLDFGNAEDVNTPSDYCGGITKSTNNRKRVMDPNASTSKPKKAYFSGKTRQLILNV